MAFERMNADLNIISKLGDIPGNDGVTPQELKELFDKAPLLLQRFINDSLIPEIEKQNVGLPIGGGTMEGSINMNGQPLTGLNAPTTDDAAANKGYVDLKAYPVGAVYISLNSTSPASLFGGTWERILGKFLLAAHDGSGYYAGTTGGAATHTLTVDQIPSHTHAISMQVADSGGFGLTQASSYTDRVLISGGGTIATNSSGGGKAYNNMPPYYAAYMWERVE